MIILIIIIISLIILNILIIIIVVIVSCLARLLTLVTNSSSVCLFRNLFYLLLLWNVAPLKQRGPYLLISL